MNTICHEDILELLRKNMTKTRALIKLKPHGSVAKRIKHEASDLLTYREKNLNQLLHYPASHDT